MIVLNRENILLDVEAADWQTVIRKAVSCLAENGYVEPRYADDVIAREREYPTGLPTEEVITALPHANSDAVRKTGVCVIRLAKPVAFRNMGDPDEILQAELVFVLANAAGADAHLEDLQELMDCFSRVGFLRDLKNAADQDELIRIFENRASYPAA